MDAAAPGEFVLHNFIISKLNLIVVIKEKKKKNLMFVSLKQLRISTKNPSKENRVFPPGKSD